MARRLGRRKEPSREKYTLKEQNKVDTGIFDEKTMMLLSKFFNKGIIERLRFITARGKEADLYIGDAGTAKEVSGKKFVIVKFFRVETSSFFNMADYIVGDYRFKRINKSKIDIIGIWCKKEFGNLKVANAAKIYAPEPYMFNGSILAMEFIGDDDGTPAPQLRDIWLEEPDKVLDIILKQVRMLYKSNLVHADLSEYNILIKNGRPYFIDFGQAVVLKHPNAPMFLRRDVKNVLSYFLKRYGIERDFDIEYKSVIS